MVILSPYLVFLKRKIQYKLNVHYDDNNYNKLQESIHAFFAMLQTTRCSYQKKKEHRSQKEHLKL